MERREERRQGMGKNGDGFSGCARAGVRAAGGCGDRNRHILPGGAAASAERGAVASRFGTVRRSGLGGIGSIFLEPLKPILPAELQLITWPSALVSVIITLLKVE